VTVITIVAAGNVSRVFAGRCDAVMAGAAGAQHLCVVDRDRRLERDCAMAVLAYVCRLHMSRALARGVGAIVATNAVSDDARMIEYSWEPGSRAMAVVALVAGRDMSGSLPGRLDAVVAADTTASYGRVVHESDHGPARCYMTVGAFTRCRYMVCRF